MDTRPEETPLLAECKWDGRIPGGAGFIIAGEALWWGLVASSLFIVHQPGWAAIAGTLAVLALSTLTIWAWLMPEGYPVRAVRAYEGGVVVESRPGRNASYAWDEVAGLRDTGAWTWRAGGLRSKAPRYPYGGVVKGVALVVGEREVSLAGCPPDQRERLVQAVEQHLRERTS